MASITPQEAARNLDRLRERIPTMVGNEIVGFALDNWDRQGFQGSGLEPWPPRRDRDTGRALLVGKQSGRLRRSVRVTSKSSKRVTAGSDLEYADIHNTGGVVRVDVTPRSRRFFWAMFHATGEDRWKWMALSKKTQFEVRIPKRQFIGTSPELDDRIRTLIAKKLSTAMGGR